MIKEAIKKVVEGKNLTREEASVAMGEIMDGKCTPSQIGCFLTALRMKGETVEEITAFADQMRKHAATITPKTGNLVDTCGTGGDVAGTFNISTLSALVAAGAGVPIAKHGNRSVSSRCGSADVLEAMGVKIDLPPEKVSHCIDEVGIGFIFAPVFHQAMKYATPSRREIGIRTVFNILGPLTNPANAKGQILGVYDPNLTELMAQVLHNLGVEHAYVVHGMDGLDEMSISAKTKVSHLKEARVENYFVEPEKFGLKKGAREALSGGNIEANVKIAQEILKGKDKTPRRDIVLLNTAAAIAVGGKAKDIREGIELAKQSIDSGKAYKKLEELIKFSKG